MTSHRTQPVREKVLLVSRKEMNIDVLIVKCPLLIYILEVQQQAKELKTGILTRKRQLPLIGPN